MFIYILALKYNFNNVTLSKAPYILQVIHKHI